MELYTNPFRKKDIELLCIDDNNLFKTAMLSKDSYYIISSTLRYLDDLLKALNEESRAVSIRLSEYTIDNPNIILTAHIPIKVAEYGIKAYFKDLVTANTQEEIQIKLEKIQNLIDFDKINELFEDLFDDLMFNIVTDIIADIEKLPYHEVLEYYYYNIEYYDYYIETLLKIIEKHILVK